MRKRFTASVILLILVLNLFVAFPVQAESASPVVESPYLTWDEIVELFEVTRKVDVIELPPFELNVYGNAHTIGDLQLILNALKSSKWVSLYELDVFDCSNMATLLSIILDSLGFHSTITYGLSYNSTKKTYIGHSMVHVAHCYYVAPDATAGLINVWIEPTSLNIFPARPIGAEGFKIIPNYYIQTSHYFLGPEGLEAANKHFPNEFTVRRIDAETIYNSLPKHCRQLLAQYNTHIALLIERAGRTKSLLQY